MGVPLGGHVEDAEAIVVKARQLPLEHGCTLLTSAYAHRRLAVEDGQLATYTDTHPTRRGAPGKKKKVDRHANTAKHTRTHIPLVTYGHTYTNESV